MMTETIKFPPTVVERSYEQATQPTAEGRQARLDRLTAACGVSFCELDADDRGTLHWLASWSDDVVAGVCRLLEGFDRPSLPVACPSCGSPKIGGEFDPDVGHWQFCCDCGHTWHYSPASNPPAA